MSALWAKFAMRFNALAERERWLTALALIAVVVFVGEMLVIEPERKRAQAAERSQHEQQEQLAKLTTQLADLQNPANDPDVAARAELEALRTQLAEQHQRLAVFDETLVPPQQMADLLETMIGHNAGLRLISLKTLPAAPLLEPKADKAKEKPLDGKSPDGKVTSADAVAPSDTNSADARFGLFKHGVEITLEGSYSDLAAYLGRLEQAKSKLLWSSVSLSAENHPKLVMKLTVYSLSLDRTWLIV